MRLVIKQLGKELANYPATESEAHQKGNLAKFWIEELQIGRYDCFLMLGKSVIHHWVEFNTRSAPNVYLLQL